MDLLGMTWEQLQALCTQEGFPSYTAKQICNWLYVKGVTEVEEMTNLSRAVRSRLSQVAQVGRVTPEEVHTSADGTRKYLFRTAPQAWVETVFIPDVSAGRYTLCISCQMGCRMGCRFCNTGRQTFHGNLTAAQILNQLYSIPERDEVTNLVFMGMGEPMDNYDAVMQSLQVLTESWGRALSPYRITLSTVGIIPGVRRFLADSRCHLAVSLHSPFAAERATLIPMQKVHPMAELLTLLRKQNWRGQRRLSFEYTLFRGINDDISHAAELATLLQGLPCRVNLIRCHATPGGEYQPPAPQTITAFEDYMNRHGIRCTLRASRGEDIMAACGLLAGLKKGDSIGSNAPSLS